MPLSRIPDVRALFLLGIAAFLVRRALYVATCLWKIRGVPRYWCLIEPTAPLSNIFPRTWWNPTTKDSWVNRNRYAERQTESLYVIPLLVGTARIHVSSPEAIKELFINLNFYSKPDLAKAVGQIMGPNVVTHNGEDWRRHRKITAPAFDGQIYLDVWDTSTRLYYEMLNSETWRSGDSHYFKDIGVFTMRLALLVIAGCGFNMDVSWGEDNSRDGTSDKFFSMITTVAKNLIALIAIPPWAFKLPIERLRKIWTAYTELQQFLGNEVNQKKAELAETKQLGQGDKSVKRNLFTRVVMASERDDVKGLDQNEIIGNLFIYLFAGHETTAWSLASTLALLSRYPDEQQKVYEHIMSVAADREIRYEDYAALSPVLHCFYEALRLFPAGTNVLRVSLADATLTGPNLTPIAPTLFAPKGTEFVMDVLNAGRSRRHFRHADEFRPRRWAESPELLEHFYSFSVGPRACLGRRFAAVEAVAFLSHMLRDWKVEAKLDKDETLEGWGNRVLDPTFGIMLRIENIPMLVTRRR